MVATVDGWVPREHVETVRALGREINTAMAGFIRGQGTVCLLLGFFYAVALSLAGLKFGLAIGLLAGALTFIPYAGALIGGVLAIGVALVQFWPDFWSIALVAAIFGVGQFLEGNFLSPKLVGKSVGLHPVWLMFALFAFGYAFGFVGLLLAVPLAAAAGVLVRFALRQYLSSRLYLGAADGPEPVPVPVGLIDEIDRPLAAGAGTAARHDGPSEPPAGARPAPPRSARAGTIFWSRRPTPPPSPWSTAIPTGRITAWCCWGRRAAASRICSRSGGRPPARGWCRGRACHPNRRTSCCASGRAAIDNAPGARLDERALFHLLNLARQTGSHVLIASETDPARWPVALPDLASRLKALPVARLGRRTTRCCAACWSSSSPTGSWPSRSRPLLPHAPHAALARRGARPRGGDRPAAPWSRRCPSPAASSPGSCSR